MRLGNQHTSDDRDKHCANCGDDSNHQPSTFSNDHVSLARRDYAKLFTNVGELTAVTNLTTPLAGLTRVFERSYIGSVYSDGIYLVDGDGRRIGENALSGGERMTVFPEPRPGIEETPTLLVKHAKDACSGATNLEYTVSGYAAHSKVCTRAGCMVSGEGGVALVCPCYFGKFDPTTGTKVIGRSPSRAFPQLPITLSSEGNLIATDGFNGPVGPGGEWCLDSITSPTAPITPATRCTTG